MGLSSRIGITSGHTIPHGRDGHCVSAPVKYIPPVAHTSRFQVTSSASFTYTTFTSY